MNKNTKNMLVWIVIVSINCGIAAGQYQQTCDVFVAPQIKYTKVSKTYCGEVCGSDCNNGICNVYNKKQPQRCFVTGDPAPVYRTSKYRGNAAYCASNCATFGMQYEWCFINENMDWDYCSSSVRSLNLLKNGQFSYNKFPCKSTCQRGYNNQFWCVTTRGYREKCNPKRISYMQSKTIYGVDCMNTCYNHGNTRYSWCNDVYGKQELCAVPGRARLS